MVPMVWMPLWQLIQASNSLYILFIIVCIISLVTIVARYSQDMESSSCTLVPQEPEEMVIRYKSSPFQMNLSEAQAGIRQDLDSGVRVTLTAHASHWFIHLWGVDIQSFHENMMTDWTVFRKQLLDGKLLNQKILWKSDPELCFETEREVCLKPAIAITATDMGQTKDRNRFPLVIMMIVNEEDESQLGENDSIGLISVLHVKDSICTMDTNFVLKLSKLKNNQVLNVSHLYTQSEATDTGASCLICMTEPITIGLLPCKHFSLCEGCYLMLPTPKICPVCRSYVLKFFRHRPDADPHDHEEYTPVGTDEDDETGTESTGDSSDQNSGTQPRQRSVLGRTFGKWFGY